jgi:hypothetical protein
MEIKKIVLTITEVKTHTVIISEANGWDMPKTPNRLVEMLDEVRNTPSATNLDATSTDSEITNFSYDIVE